jgi:DNA-binding response OmpR family regulator
VKKLWDQLLGLRLTIKHKGTKLKKMLIVENDNLSIKFMRRTFRDGFEVSICDSAEEFYEKYSNNYFDLIIMDISLNGTKNGFELIREIRNIPMYYSTPIICLTAHAQNEVRQIAIESGSDLFIVKPVPNKMLKDAVEALANRISVEINYK